VKNRIRKKINEKIISIILNTDKDFERKRKQMKIRELK